MPNPTPQHLQDQPSQEELAEGLPSGFPLKREHLNDLPPLAADLRARLDRIMNRTREG